MTQQKSLFNKNLFTEDIKQNKYITILYTILLLLITTLPAMIMYTAYLEPHSGVNLKDIAEILTMANPIAVMVNTLAAFVFAVLQFNYLYKSNSVIFYHSLPYTRQNLMITKFLAGFVSFFIPLIVVFIVNYVINVSIGLQYAVSFYSMFKIFVFIVLTTLFTYSVITFAQSFCSNIFALFIATAFIFLVYPLSKMIIMGSFIAHFNTFELNMAFPAIKYNFPMFYYYSDKEMLTVFNVNMLIYLLIAPIVLLILSCAIYAKRKSENSNKFFAFDFANKFLKYYITVFLSFGAGAVIAEISPTNLIMEYIVHLITAVIVFAILQAIFDKNIKNMFANKKQLTILLVIIAICVTFLSKDILKINSMMPNINKTKFIETDIYTDFNLNNGTDRSMSRRVKFEESENIKNVINLLKLGKGVNISHYDNDDNNLISVYAKTPVGQKYGFSRRVVVSRAEYEKFIENIYDTKEFKEKFYFVPKAKKVRDLYVDPFNYEKEVQNNHVVLESSINELLTTYKEDATMYNYNDIKGKKVLFNLSISYISENDAYDHMDLPVYENFDKTIKEIEKIVK